MLVDDLFGALAAGAGPVIGRSTESAEGAAVVALVQCAQLVCVRHDAARYSAG
jgi:hypothetical protein